MGDTFYGSIGAILILIAFYWSYKNGTKM